MENLFKLPLSAVREADYFKSGKHTGIMELSLIGPYNEKTTKIAIQTEMDEDGKGGFMKIYTKNMPLYESTGRQVGNFHYITILSTPCNFGGRRYWFMCPRTGKRYGILYIDDKGDLGSRVSKKLLYPRQLEPKSFRGYRKMMGESLSKIEELRASIKYPYRNGKPTRKQRRLLRFSRDEEHILEGYNTFKLN